MPVGSVANCSDEHLEQSDVTWSKAFLKISTWLECDIIQKVTISDNRRKVSWRFLAHAEERDNSSALLCFALSIACATSNLSTLDDIEVFIHDRVARHQKKRTGKRSERGRFFSELKSFVRAFHGMMFIFHKHREFFPNDRQISKIGSERLWNWKTSLVQFTVWIPVRMK